MGVPDKMSIGAIWSSLTSSQKILAVVFLVLNLVMLAAIPATLAVIYSGALKTKVTTPPSCPDHWTYFNGFCYKVLRNINGNFLEKNLCRNEYGSVGVSIHNQEENNFVSNLVGAFECWLFAIKGNTSTTWIWLDGSAWDYENWADITITTESQETTDPSDSSDVTSESSDSTSESSDSTSESSDSTHGSSESNSESSDINFESSSNLDCLRMLSNGKWLLTECGENVENYVCKVKQDTITTTTATVSTGSTDSPDTTSDTTGDSSESTPDSSDSTPDSSDSTPDSSDSTPGSSDST